MPPDKVLESSVEIDYLPFDKRASRDACAKSLHIPNTTDWCPTTLVDVEQLRNYYLQERRGQE